jgi:hypothetical protein
MVIMPLMCSTLIYDIKWLEAQFTHGFRIEANVFYVLLTFKKGVERTMIKEENEQWKSL